MEEPKTSR